MKRVLQGFEIHKLTKELCLNKKEEILGLLKLIPNSHYKIEDIMADKKGERYFYGKWEYSLILMKGEEVVGVVIGYERARENEGSYNENCFYINEIAISQRYRGRGLGREFLKYFIESLGKYKYLDGEVKIRIQTEKSETNKKVIELYKSVGFKEVGIKEYPLKKDIIMEIKNNRINLV